MLAQQAVLWLQELLESIVVNCTVHLTEKWHQDVDIMT